MGRHVCFIFFFFLLSSSGELSTERIELKFSLKIALWFENKLHIAIRPVIGLQYSKIDLGYNDFHYNCIITVYSKNVSPEVFLGAEFDRDIQNWAKILGTV